MLVLRRNAPDPRHPGIVADLEQRSVDLGRESRPLAFGSHPHGAELEDERTATARPARRWRKNTAPGDVSLMATATTANSGDRTIRPSVEAARSMARLASRATGPSDAAATSTTGKPWRSSTLERTVRRSNKRGTTRDLHVARQGPQQSGELGSGGGAEGHDDVIDVVVGDEPRQVVEAADERKLLPGFRPGVRVVIDAADDLETVDPFESLDHPAGHETGSHDEDPGSAPAGGMHDDTGDGPTRWHCHHAQQDREGGGAHRDRG